MSGAFLDDFEPRVTFTRPRLTFLRQRTMREIAADVAERHGIRVSDMQSDRRTGPLVRARQEFWWLVRKETHQSLPAMAKFMGGRDHTTALHGIRQHERRQEPGYVPYKPVPPRRPKVAA